jgi:GntR family transcriptional regulator
MISFEKFTAEDGIPVYLQIVRFIKRGVVSGAVKDGDEVPSRRVLSALLGLNPNTVQKAYRILEEEKLMENHAGAKSYMAVDAEAAARIRRELLQSDAAAVVKRLKEMGLTKAEAARLIETYWEEEENV